MEVIHSIADYISVISRLRKTWKVPKHHELWFRAEQEQYRKTRLQPGIYRPNETTGIRKPVRRLLELENRLYEEFKRCSVQLSDGKSAEEDWEWDSFFLMQHHGVPTRLLDWSDGGLIALHFAVRHKPPRPNTGSIIYVLDPYALLSYLEKHSDRQAAKARWEESCASNVGNLDAEEWERLYLPADEDDVKDPLMATPVIPMLSDMRHLTRRVAAQRSQFMIFGTDPFFISNWGEKKDSRLVPIRLPAGSVDKVKQELRDSGITESVIFPDLDGLGRELTQQWKAWK